jgi:sugar O-acyltransferase (sialic acid O-acetyltransferase NeuD family)
VIGAGGHGKVVCDAALAAGLGEPFGFVDDNQALVGTRVLGVPVIGPLTSLAGPAEIVLVMGIGSNAARRRAFESARSLGYTVREVIHPAALIGRECRIGAGAVLLARVTVNAGSQIGENVILNTACSIDHDCRIGAHAHVAPGTTLAGNVIVGDEAFLGAGVVAIPGVSIGARAVVGAGAVVVRDLPADCRARGVPARAVTETRCQGPSQS